MNARVMKQMEIAHMCLSLIEKFDPRAIIAGGAPRDWYMDKVATDIDIFFFTHSSIGGGLLRKHLGSLGFVGVEQVGGEFFPAQYRLNPNIQRVFNAKVYGWSTPIQLIQYKKPTFGVVETFPLSISQAWFKRGEIHTTKHFQNSVKNKVVYKTSELYANGHAYIEKIRGKFPDYEYFESYTEFLESRVIL